MDNTNFHFLGGGGEMGELIRATDWSKTPIGSPANWPTALCTSVSLMLNNLFPMYIAWGEEYTQLYNDGYRPILGVTKHPQAMGIGTKETFREIWNTIGPMFEGVMQGTPVGFPDFKLRLERNGYPEDCYFDFCYSPIRNDDGSVGGVLVTVIETTEKYKSFISLDEAKRKLEKSQAETNKERDRLKRFFKQAPAGICVLDGPELIFELVNPLYQQLFPGRDLLGRPLLEGLPEITGQPIVDILYEVYNTGKTYEGHQLLIPLARSENGPLEDRYFDFIYQARLNQDDQVDGIMVFVYEVTETVGVHKRVEESEKRFRTLVEQAPVALLVNRGDDLVFDTVNQPMIDMIGKGDGIKGKPWYEAVPELAGHPIVDQMYHTYQTGEEWRGVEVPILFKNKGYDEQRYFNLVYRPLLEEGKITGLLQSAVEVTEQVNARRDLEHVKDTLSLAMLAAELGMFDLDLIAGSMYWDERCRRLFGINHNNPVSFEMDFVGGLHPSDRDRIIKEIEGVYDITVNNGNYDVEYRTIGAEDKRLRWVRAKGKAYFDENANPIRFIGAVRDITQEKTDEIRKNDFIGMVSHELKTPLTSLTALLQVLHSKAEKEQNQDRLNFLKKAVQQVKKMNTLINGFLDITRLETGKIYLNKSYFSMDVLVKEMVDEARLTISNHNIIFEPCEAEPVYADRDKLGSVIMNLITNAGKYSVDGKPIKIKCMHLDECVQVSVQDEGMGVTKEEAERLFERFFRVESNENKFISGFGIGLYLSAEIIQRHSGKIWVESEIGKGSTFYFSLPVGSR